MGPGWLIICPNCKSCSGVICGHLEICRCTLCDAQWQEEETPVEMRRQYQIQGYHPEIMKRLDGNTMANVKVMKT